MTTNDTQSDVPARSGNGIGTAGFVTGVIGLIFAPIPVVGVVAWPLVIVGLVLAITGLHRARQGAPNKGLSIAGVVCSAVGLAICLLWAVAIGGAVSDPAASSGTGQSASQGSAGGSAQQQDESLAGIGDPVRDGMFEFTVTKVETGIQHVGGPYVGTDAEGQFVIVHVTVTNIGDEPRMLSMSAQKLHDVQGRVFAASNGAALLALPDAEAFLNTINPGNTVRAKLLFDVPEDVRLASIELHDSAYSGGVRVSLKAVG